MVFYKIYEVSKFRVYQKMVTSKKQKLCYIKKRTFYTPLHTHFRHHDAHTPPLVQCVTPHHYTIDIQSDSDKVT
jgi:hypothetical protein